MKTRSATRSKSRRGGAMMSARSRSRGMRPAASRSRRTSRKARNAGSRARPRSRLSSTRARGAATSRSRRTATRATVRGRSAGRRSARGAAKRGGAARRSGSAQTTRDHNQIRQWVEARGGHPATVRATVKGRDPAGLLRIDFPGFSGGKSLKAISWDEFFEVFDERNLTFLYQERASSGKPSRFNKLVCKR